MIEYDLRRLSEHPLKFRSFIPSAIATFGGQRAGQYSVRVRWRLSEGGEEQEDELVLQWDTEALTEEVAHLEEEIDILLSRDEDRPRRIELAAVIIAVAVMAHVEPAKRFCIRSGTGTSHDYYLTEERDEMIEVAGRWVGGLGSLFAEKRTRSELNPRLKKRWISVTIFQRTARNRTEGLHS